MEKRKLSFWQIWNEFRVSQNSNGFRFANSNVSRIFQTLEYIDIPILWVAPMTGLIIQPIGNLFL
jgi:hypothetical protein